MSATRPAVGVAHLTVVPENYGPERDVCRGDSETATVPANSPSEASETTPMRRD